MVQRLNARKTLRPVATATVAVDAAGVLAPTADVGSVGNQPDDYTQGVGPNYPVGLDSQLAPWRSPQFLPGAPHRLPAPVVRTPLPLVGTQPAAGSDEATAAANAPVPVATPVVDPWHCASINATNCPVPTAATQTPFLTAPQGKRNLLGLRNPNAAGTIYIDFGQSASALSWLALAPGVQMLFDEVVSQDDLYCFGSQAGLTLCFAYSNISA